MKLDSKKKITAFVAQAVCHFLAVLDDKELVSDELFDKLFPHVNISQIPDKYIISNQRIRDRIDWNSLEKFQLIRLLGRDIDLLENVDLSRYNFKVMELYPLLLIYPELIDCLEIDFDNLSSYEAIKLLECNNELIGRMQLSKYKLSKIETIEVIRKFGENNKIMSQVNLKSLDHFELRNLLKKTGSKYIKKINLNNLKVTDWIDILDKKPDLLSHCNLLLFEKNDCYPLVKLVEMFPQLDYMIEENKDKISSLGWERLIIMDLGRYRGICNWESLSKKNWNNIIRYHPELKPMMGQHIL